MGNFGFVSPLLEMHAPWYQLRNLLPEKWCFLHGPLKTGNITGFLPKENVQGWGWRIPADLTGFWGEQKFLNLWKKFSLELHERGIKVIGLDSKNSSYITNQLLKQSDFLDISDGKAFELLLFISYFRSIFRNHGISAQKAKAMIVWEEGNLGITCARLIAREVRFLTLINPNPRLLERAACLIVSETGVSPLLFTAPPEEIKTARIVIICGRLNKYTLMRGSRRTIWCELFQKPPSLAALNTEFPITALNKIGRIPLYPALGEAILRAYFDLNSGFWFGSELPLDRVLRLSQLFKELNVEIIL
jgi:hypothetical protein